MLDWPKCFLEPFYRKEERKKGRTKWTCRSACSFLAADKKENTHPVRDFACEISSFLRHFDNVVKEYTYLFGNVLISVACAELYPDKFELNATVVLSLALLFVGIYVYEEKRVKNEGPREGSVKIM